LVQPRNHSEIVESDEGVLTIEEHKNRLDKLFITVIGRMKMEREGWLIGYMLTAYQAAVAATLVQLQHLLKIIYVCEKHYFCVNQKKIDLCRYSLRGR
jgi:hypothetical protein